jgi:hypothetical protein
VNGSPFVATVQRLEPLVGALGPRAQTLFFCCATRALLADRIDDVDEVLAAAQAFALTGRVPDAIPKMLAALEEQQARLDEHDVVAHDGLICADIALRITYGGFKAQDGVWYVLEPQFQATSERLFGFTDVGSEREKRDEAIALRDTMLARAVDAIEVAVEQLSAEPTQQEVAVLCATLRALRP